MMDSLFEKWDNDGCGYLDMEDVETVMQKYKEGQENEAIVRGKTDKDQCKIFILRLIYFGGGGFKRMKSSEFLKNCQ